MTNQNTNPDYYKDAEKTALVRLCGVLGVLTENNDLSTAALLAATRIERLEKKIPALNVDLAEASMHAYNGEIARMKLEAELARLNAERRWIPVSERLPEIHDDYDGEKSDCCYAIDIHKCVWIAYYRPDEKDWYELPAGIILTTITHWMPLPEPPEGERC